MNLRDLVPSAAALKPQAISLDVLRETGCYADFTFPSAGSRTQPRKINSIYYAIDDPDRPRSHDRGIDVGTAPPPANGLILIQGPLLLVGMDTPQVRPDDVAAVFEHPERDAWFGPAEDGGFWALYLHVPDGTLIRGVPMSRDDTGAVQRERLVDAGLDVGDLTPLLDVDEIADADRVAGLAPDSAFAAALASERTTSGGAR